MSETSMIATSGTQVGAEGTTRKVTIEHGETPASSGYVAKDVTTFPVRVKTSDDKVLVRVDVELVRRQKETEQANEEIRRRLRG